MTQGSIIKQLMISGLVALATVISPVVAMGSNPFEEQDVNFAGYEDVSSAWGDYNNDGHLDYICSGVKTGGVFTSLYHNNGDSTFTEKVDLIFSHRYCNDLAWGDYNNDGYLDLLMTGGGSTLLCENSGTGSFSYNLKTSFTGLTSSSIAWGDYNNDGYLDIALSGKEGADKYVTQIYSNNKNGTFTEQTEISLIGVYNSDVEWADYNNDGYLDLIVGGAANDTYSNCQVKIYKNNGNNTFTEQSSITLTDGYKTNYVWGDYNSDGLLDLLLTSTKSNGEVYKNNGAGGFTKINSVTLEGGYAGADSWVDYDCDGDLDIALNGFGVDGKIYKNNGNNSFTHQSSITYTSTDYGGAPWADYDNDGDLDFAIAGYINQGSDKTNKLYRNNSLVKNLPPQASTEISSSVEGNIVTLKWAHATDDHTKSKGLSYNIRVGTTSGGNDVMSSNSDANGFLRLPALGNVQMDTMAILKDLPNGTYYWSVQAVDNCFKGGVFSVEDSFTIDVEVSITNIPEANVSIYPNPSQNRLYFTGLNDGARIIITNNLGQLVLNTVNTKNGIDISTLDRGQYILRCLAGGKVLSVKFVKE